MRGNTTPWGGAAAVCILFLTACGGGGVPGPFELPNNLSLLLPSGHGLGAGEIRVAPGASEERGNVVVACPAGGRACVVTVAADGTATYDRTGGAPTVAAAFGAWDLPSGHGLGAGEIRVAPGASEERGNVVVACPAGGRACVVTVAADGTATYDRTGGAPTVAAAFGAWDLPSGHGLGAGEIRVAPGASEERGNVVVACPAGGRACVVTVAADGTATYDRTGGAPTVAAAFGAWDLPSGHGLGAGEIRVAPGASEEHGNVVVACPAGGRACVVTVAADGTATYDRTGGTPGVTGRRLPFPLLAVPFPHQPLRERAPYSQMPTSTYHYGTSRLPALSRPRLQHQPIYHDSPYVLGSTPLPTNPQRRLLVGIDPGLEPRDLPSHEVEPDRRWGWAWIMNNTSLTQLAPAGEHGDFALYSGELRDGMRTEAIEEYLGWEGPRVDRFVERPRLRIIGNASSREQQHVYAAVQLVNAALPEAFKIAVQPNQPEMSLRSAVDGRGYIYDSRYRNAGAFDQTIHVEFINYTEYYDVFSGGTAWSLYGDLDDVGGDWDLAREIDGGYIQMRRGTPAYENNRKLTILLAHELLHTMGIGGHVGTSDSIMGGRGSIYLTYKWTPQPMSLLYPADREALRILYSRMEPDDHASEYGVWAEESFHLHATGPHAAFGVVQKNGYVEPWAGGRLPDMDLADNPTLLGSATWLGRLLGFSDTRPVAGSASLTVDLANLDGTAAFTRLETWTGAIGDVGSGRRWGDGDLRYTIEVLGNTFYETGGDDGRLTGIFTGARHEGAAGTLERTDLTAAFGATR